MEGKGEGEMEKKRKAEREIVGVREERHILQAVINSLS